MFEPLSKADRDRLVADRLAARARYEALADRFADVRPSSAAEATARADAERAFQEFLAAERDYFEQLPRLGFGACPFDGRPLMRSIDPYGVDGAWWEPDAVTVESPPCPHFCVLDGVATVGPAAGAPPAASVVPRLLAHPTMTGVLCRHDLPAGVRLCTVAYFAERRPVPEDSTANWPRPVYVYTTQRLTHGWRLARERRDRDLGPWLARGALRWCEPGSDNTVLATGDARSFPYADFGLAPPGPPGAAPGV